MLYGYMMFHGPAATDEFYVEDCEIGVHLMFIGPCIVVIVEE